MKKDVPASNSACVELKSESWLHLTQRVLSSKWHLMILWNMKDGFTNYRFLLEHSCQKIDVINPGHIKGQSIFLIMERFLTIFVPKEKKYLVKQTVIQSRRCMFFVPPALHLCEEHWRAGVKVHRAHVRDVETVHTIHLAHERDLFSAGKCSPHMSEVDFRPESAPRT